MDDIIVVMTIGLFLEAAQFAPFFTSFFIPFQSIASSLAFPTEDFPFLLLCRHLLCFLSFDSSVILLGLHIPLSNYLALTK